MKLLTLLSCFILAGFTFVFGEKINHGKFPPTKTTANDRVRTIPIHSKVKFQGDLDLTVKGNFITLFEAKSNRAVLLKINPKTDTVQQMWDLKGEQFPYKQLLRKTKYNALLYEQLRPQLVKNGDDIPWILGSFAQDSALSLLIEFILPRAIDGVNKYVPEPVYFIYTKHYFNNRKDLNLIDINSLNEKTQKKFTLHLGKPFFKIGENIFLTLVDTSSRKNPINQLSEWSKITNGNYEAKNTEHTAYNAEEYKNLHLDSTKLGVNYRYLFSTNASLVYDYRKNEKIPIKTMTLFHGALLQDVKEKKDQLLLLVNKKKTLDAMVYDKSLEQIFGQVPFTLPSNCLWSSVKFCGENSLSVLSADRKLIHIVRIE